MVNSEKKTGMSRKWAFFQALLLTVVIFVIGMYAGVLLEEGKFEEVNDYYITSEVSMMDILSLDNLIGSVDVSCSELEIANYNLLDRVYEESRILTQYEESEKMTESLKNFHRKYDVMRTYLWINAIKIKEVCKSEINTIVYLYNYDEEDLTKKAEQNVWSRLLGEVKAEKGREVVLIPIAVDPELVSLKVLVEKYGIKTYPSVIVNDQVFEELVEKEEVLGVLN